MNLNQVTLVGRLGQDPDMRYTAGGTAVANFSVATSYFVKKQEGGYDEKTIWVDVTAWGKVAERVVEYAQKGAEVLVEGRLDNRSWDDKDGKKQFRTFVTANGVQIGSGRKTTGEGSQEAPPKTESQESTTTPPPPPPPEDDSDDLPF